MMKTYMAKSKEVIRKWYLVDAEGKVLGRLATRIAMILRGKTKAIYTPHVDTGDQVIVINASKVAVTGRKLKQKLYRTYSGYPGGLKEKNLETMLKKKPEEVIIRAVKGMLPHNKLGRKMLRKLKVYRGASHPHQAHRPEILEV